MFYEYKCEKCGHVHQLQRLMKDRNDPVVCPECGGEAKKIMSKTQKIPSWGHW